MGRNEGTAGSSIKKQEMKYNCVEWRCKAAAYINEEAFTGKQIKTSTFKLWNSRWNRNHAHASSTRSLSYISAAVGGETTVSTLLVHQYSTSWPHPRWRREEALLVASNNASIFDVACKIWARRYNYDGHSLSHGNKTHIPVINWSLTGTPTRYRLKI